MTSRPAKPILEKAAWDGLLACQPACGNGTSAPLFMNPIQIPNDGGKKVNILGIPMVIRIH
ncbi:MAG TPA: hypothetical protein VJT54_17375, partial [Verrucomicrobiae bacterium]|nr:hypothetical protein [Verrucomicrobiae bacterium]